MLTVYGRATKYCDGISRRSFLKIGGFAMGSMASLSLADILRAESTTGKRFGHKAVINVFLGGGPPHQDMWDIKTEAPVEIRGEFRPIDTKVPGIQIGEVFPKIAAQADKCVFVRSVVGCPDRHEAFHCYTGWTRESLSNMGGRPSIGAAMARLRGSVERSVPPSVALAAKTQHTPWSDPGATGFLGAGYGPFKPEGDGRADLALNGISTDRLGDRKALLTSLDCLKRDMDTSGALRGMDDFNQAAFGVLTSSKLLEALDLSKEDPKLLERYGTGKPYNFQYDGAPTCNDQLLMARRLVEAGVRCVTMTFGRWDSHGDNFGLVRDHGGKLDQCVSALVQDLDERGMLRDVTIAVWGEFGRTPRINGGKGRDHWPQVSCALLIGGGMRTGQVIGSTNRLGEHANDRPVHFQEIVSTIYHNLGFDTASTAIIDSAGRPQHLVDKPPMREVV